MGPEGSWRICVHGEEDRLVPALPVGRREARCPLRSPSSTPSKWDRRERYCLTIALSVPRRRNDREQTRVKTPCPPGLCALRRLRRVGEGTLPWIPRLASLILSPLARPGQDFGSAGLRSPARSQGRVPRAAGEADVPGTVWSLHPPRSPLFIF